MDCIYFVSILWHNQSQERKTKKRCAVPTGTSTSRVTEEVRPPLPCHKTGTRTPVKKCGNLHGAAFKKSRCRVAFSGERPVPARLNNGIYGQPNRSPATVAGHTLRRLRSCNGVSPRERKPLPPSPTRPSFAGWRRVGSPTTSVSRSARAIRLARGFTTVSSLPSICRKPCWMISGPTFPASS